MVEKEDKVLRFIIGALILVLVLWISFMTYDMECIKKTQVDDYNHFVNKTNELAKHANVANKENEILREAYVNLTRKYKQLYEKYNATFTLEETVEIIKEPKIIKKKPTSVFEYMKADENYTIMPHIEHAFPSVIIKRYDMNFLNRISLEKKKENKEHAFLYKARFDKVKNAYKIYRVKEADIIKATSMEIWPVESSTYTGTIHTHLNRICEMSYQDIFWYGYLSVKTEQHLHGIWCGPDSLAFYDKESIYKGVSLEVIIDEG